MNDNLPPLPPYAPEFKPRWPTDPGGYNEEQMQAYAREAIERQSVPDLNRLAPFVGGLGKAILQELIEDMAAAPQPQPVQEPVAYLDIGAGGYLDIATNLTDEQLLALPKGRHALVIAGTFGIDGYTSPQAQAAHGITKGTT